MLAVSRKGMGIVKKWNYYMKNIFLLGFTGGSCGDFLCSQISKDESFYSLQSEMTSNVNRCELENPFASFGLDIKNPYWPDSVTISDADYKNIDIAFADKNLILPTHYFFDLKNINLPRIAGIKLCSKQLTPLFYILLWIKRWRYANTVEGQDIAKWSSNSEIINEIISRGYFYAFEKTALRLNVSNSIDLSTTYFFNYNNLSKKVADGWVPYNIDNLFLDTKNSVIEFSRLFNMSQPINAEDIIHYHQNNIRLVENYFNKSYDNLIAGNWLLELKERIKTDCPNAYCIS